MKKRRRSRGNRRHLPHPKGVPLHSKPSNPTGFLAKPEMRLALGMGQLLLNYACEKFLPKLQPGGTAGLGELTDELRAKIEASIQSELKVHPEAREPIWTSIDERQEGRSEVIRAIANPKQS